MMAKHGYIRSKPSEHKCAPHLDLTHWLSFQILSYNFFKWRDKPDKKPWFELSAQYVHVVYFCITLRPYIIYVYFIRIGLMLDSACKTCSYSQTVGAKNVLLE